MAFNGIAPTASRENRKRPTTLPQGVYLAADATTGILGFTDTPSEAEYMLKSNAAGLIGTETFTAGESWVVRAGSRAIVLTVPTE